MAASPLPSPYYAGAAPAGGAFVTANPLLAAAAGWGQGATPQALPAFVHVLTHKDLHLHPWQFKLAQEHPPTDGRATQQGQWFSAAAWPALGLPAPVRRLLEAG
jgi:A/G-specific adenine glycosylase